MRTRVILRTVGLGIVVVATLLAMAAPALGQTTAPQAQPCPPGKLCVAGVETSLGYQPDGGGVDDHAGVRFRGMLFNRLTGHGDWWLSGSGTTLVAVDYVGRPWEYRQATIEDTDGQMAAGYVRAWVPVGGSYAFLTGLITSGTVQWPVKATGEWDRSSRCMIADQNRPDAAEVSVNLAGPQLLKFEGCLDDCAIAFGLPGILYRGCPVMPRIWGEFTLATGLDQVQGSAALPSEDELEPEFRIEENWLFLPMIQVPAD